MKSSWFSRFFSAEFSESSKRLVLIVLVFVFIIITFLLMYIHVLIANEKLLDKQLDNLFWLIAIFGGFIGIEGVSNLFKRKAELQADVDMQKAKAGIPDTKIEVENVENVDAKNVNLEQKKPNE